MKLNELSFTHLSLLGLLLVAGACSAPSTQMVRLPDQSVPITDKEWARVYFMRPPQAYGKTPVVSVYDNDVLIGHVGNGGYLCWERPPGRSLLKGVYNPVEVGWDKTEGLFSQDVVAGGVYYCAVSIERGPLKPIIRGMSSAEASAIIGDLKAPKFDGDAE